jgi:hypothetical protein
MENIIGAYKAVSVSNELLNWSYNNNIRGFSNILASVYKVSGGDIVRGSEKVFRGSDNVVGGSGKVVRVSDKFLGGYL